MAISVISFNKVTGSEYNCLSNFSALMRDELLVMLKLSNESQDSYLQSNGKFE